MRTLTTSKQAVGLAGWLALAFSAAALGSIASVHAKEFYGGLVQPSWAPPPWIFGPVWSFLYLLMGISAWLVWREVEIKSAPKTFALFFAQLAANALWSWLFFFWHQGSASSVEIVVLWILILCTLVAFWRIRTRAGLLLLPYLAWVTFATGLCITVWKLNPAVLGN